MFGRTTNVLNSSLCPLGVVKVLKWEKAGGEIKLWLRVIRKGEIQALHSTLSGLSCSCKQRI